MGVFSKIKKSISSVFGGAGDFISDIIKISTFGLIDVDDLFGGPGGLPPFPRVPTRKDVGAEAIARATRRRALFLGGRESTLLVDDTETPIGRQIPAGQIGRATLLSG